MNTPNCSSQSRVHHRSGLAAALCIFLTGAPAIAFPGGTTVLTDDFSTAAPLDDYSLFNPYPSSVHSPMNVFISGQQLSYRWAGGFGVTLAVHSQGPTDRITEH